MIVTGKIRTRKKLLKTIISKIEDNAIGGSDYNDQIFISNADNMELVNEIKPMIEEKFPNINDGVQVFNIGPTIGSHIGPGTLAIFYWGKERMA